MKPSLKKKSIGKHINYLLFPFLLFFCYYIWCYKESFLHSYMNYLQKFIGEKLQGLRISLSLKKKNTSLCHTPMHTKCVCICVSLCKIFPNLFVHVYICVCLYIFNITYECVYICTQIYIYIHFSYWYELLSGNAELKGHISLHMCINIYLYI